MVLHLHVNRLLTYCSFVILFDVAAVVVSEAPYRGKEREAINVFVNHIVYVVFFRTVSTNYDHDST